MANTDYVPSRDGDFLVTASVLQAAFDRYHQLYLADKAGIMHYKGSVSTYADLPTTGMINGDVYKIDETGDHYI